MITMFSIAYVRGTLHEGIDARTLLTTEIHTSTAMYCIQNLGLFAVTR